MNDTSHPDLGWGTPSHPVATPPSRMGFLVAMLAVTLGLGVLAVGGGLVMIAIDLADTTDDWHGLGIVLGLMAAVPGLVVAALAGIALRFRRTAPRRTRMLGYVLGGLWLCSTLLGGIFGFITSFPFLFPFPLPFAALGLALVGSAAMAQVDRP